MSATAVVSNLASTLHGTLYRGLFRRGAAGHSTDSSLLSFCASGGLVTSLLSERLDRGLSDGAIVARFAFDANGAAHPQTTLARSACELRNLAGSVYSDFSHVDGVLRILEGEKGVFDIVALPCQLARLRNALEKRGEMFGRAGLLLGLWCGHATGSGLLDTLLDRWGIDRGDIADLRYRCGHWRGRTRITMKDGSVRERSFARGYGLYQNMYSDCAVRCFSCSDHFGEAADISFGDCWVGTEKKAEYKKTMAISITGPGDDAIDLLLASPACDMSEVDPILAVEAQKRSVVWHTYSCAARARLGGFFRMSIGCGADVSPRWNDFVSAFLTLLYFRSFGGRLRGLLFRLPWWVLFPFMAFQKLMLNR